MPKLRVLVVDDSAFMRTAVVRMLEADGRFEVVGQGKDGLEAQRLARDLEPDVISMDFNMPGQNGAQATSAILAQRAVPIVMLSAHTTRGAQATLQALAAGAIDFVAKPDGEVSVHLARVKDELTNKLLAAARVNLRGLGPGSLEPLPQSSARQPGGPARAALRGPRVLALAASTGGPQALARLLPRLNVQKDLLVLIVQHMPEGYTRALAQQLAEGTSYPVLEAQGGEQLNGGVAYVARGGAHLMIAAGGLLALSGAAPEHGVRPAADCLFRSVASYYGARSVGVVLTGMGKDGALGLAAIKAAGGATLAQDEASSVVYGMPKAAVQMGVVDTIAPLERIATLVNRLVSPTP